MLSWEMKSPEGFTIFFCVSLNFYNYNRANPIYSIYSSYKSYPMQLCAYVFGCLYRVEYNCREGGKTEMFRDVISGDDISRGFSHFFWCFPQLIQLEAYAMLFRFNLLDCRQPNFNSLLIAYVFLFKNNWTISLPGIGKQLTVATLQL